MLGTPDPLGLARFSEMLLGWPVSSADDPWPGAPGGSRCRCNLDIGVTDLRTSVEDAVSLRARLAQPQPQDDVRVLLDPAGHPFCLYLDTD